MIVDDSEESFRVIDGVIHFACATSRKPVGADDYTHLITDFLDAFGMSPSETAKLDRNQIELIRREIQIRRRKYQ